MNVNRMKKRILLLLLVIPALIKAQDVMTETCQELTSPDGAYRFTFYQRAVGEDNTQMYYTLTYKNRPVIEESKLGVLIENQLFESALGIPNDTCHFWCENLKLTGTEHQKTDEIWKPVYGERAEVRDCYNEMTLKFKKGEGKGNQDGGYDKRKNYFMNIIVRAYNEGVAFRYHFPEMTNGLFLHIVGEQTSFTMPEGTMAYYERWAQGPYELRPLKGWGKEESERPLTLKLPDGLSVALLEAEMVDYVRGKFRLSAEKPSTLETSLYSSVDIISPYSTPWRVIMAAERPVDLINNNDIVLNLNPACKLADTSWIKPGKVFRSGDLKQDRVKAAIDFAAERGIQYVHMDAGWYGPEMKMSSDATTVSPDKDLDIPALCKYAESKGIGLMVYVNQRALVQQLDTLLLNKKVTSDTKISVMRQVIVENEQSSAKDSTQVIALFDRMMKQDIDDPQIPMLYSQYLLSKNMEQEAVPVLEQVVDLDPTNKAARLMLVSAAVKKEDYKQIIKVCEPGIEATPDALELYYYLAIAYHQAEQTDSVLSVCSRALEHVTADTRKEVISDFYSIMGDIYHTKKQMAEAYAAYDSSLVYNPSNIGALNNYAYYLSVERRDLDKAEEMSYKTVKAEPNNSTYLDTYAWILFEKGNYAEARIYIDNAMKNDGEKSDVIVEHCGDIYFMTGDVEGALKYWKKALEMGSESKTLKQKIEKKKYIAE